MSRSKQFFETRPIAVTHTHTAVRAIALLLVCVVMTGLTATAQVEWKDRYVTLASGDQKNPSIAQPPGGSYTIIVWEDYRSGSSDIYAQKIENVNGVAVWFPIDGVPVCTAEGEQRNPRAVINDSGNVIISWEDYRGDQSEPFNPNQNISEVWATVIRGIDGSEVPSWIGGRSISGSTGYRAYRPRLAGTLDGAFLTWTDMRDTTGHPVGTSHDVYAQYLLSATQISPTGWAAGGNRVNTNVSGEQQNSEIVIDSIRMVAWGRCGAVIAYEDVSNSIGQITMCRMDSAGSPVWSDLSIAYTNTNQQNVKIAHAGTQDWVDGSSMMVVATWEDERNRQTSDVDVYAQMVELYTGVPQWPNTTTPTGLQITRARDRQINPDIVIRNTSAAIVWEDLRDYSSTGIDIYANEVELNTQSLLDTNGVEVCVQPGNQEHFSMSKTAETNRLWVGWDDWRTGSADVYYQKLNWSGLSQQLQSEGWPVTLAKGNQTETAMGSDVFVFTDSRRQAISNDNQSDLNIYAQKPGDECDGPTNMHWKDELAKWTLDVDASDHRFAVDGSGNTYVVWREERTVSPYGGIYAQKMDVDGVPRWTNDGVLLSENDDSGMPDVCASTSGSAIFVWRESGGVRVAKVDASGSISWRSDCTCNSGDCDVPRVATAGNDIFIAYANSDEGVWIDVFSSGGTLSGGVKMFDDFKYRRLLICSDSVSGCYIAATKSGNATIYFGHVNSAFSKYEDFYQYNNEPLRWVSGYDLVIDPLTWNANAPKQAILAFTDWLNAYVIKIKKTSRGLEKVPSNKADAIIGPTGGYYRSICVSSDGIRNAVDSLGCGALLAWDHTEYVAALTDTSHIVQTQRAIWSSSNVSGFWATPLNLINYASKQIDDTKPDIALRSSSEMCIGIVAWQDNRTPWCPDEAVIAQCVNYVNATKSQAMLWDTLGRQISPILGTTQSNIQIEYGPVTSGVGMIAAYWLDTRSGYPFVTGTRLDDEINESSHSMVIRKENTIRTAASELLLDQNYPNPVSVSSGRMISIGFSTANAGVCTITLYDALGRRIAILADGWREAGTYNVLVPYSTASYLTAGVYRYELKMGTESVSRMMVVVH